MQKHIITLLAVSLLGMTVACKTAKPDIEVEYQSQENRPDWKDKIDHGEIGYYNISSENTINLDSPPHLKERQQRNIPEPEMTGDCEKFISQNGNRSSKIEFLVGVEGQTDRFYVLESAGPCDDLLVQVFTNETFIPGTKSEQEIPTLVHVEYRFANR